MCVCSTGGLLVGTPVYNTNGCEIDPQQCRCFSITPPPSAPSCKMSTVFPRLNARAFIFFGVRFTRRLNGAGVYTGPAFISLC